MSRPKTRKKTVENPDIGGCDRVRTVIRMVDRMVKGDPQSTCSYGSQTPHIYHHYTLPTLATAHANALAPVVNSYSLLALSEPVHNPSHIV